MGLDDKHDGQLEVRQREGKWVITDPYHRTFSYAYELEADALRVATIIEETWKDDRVNWKNADDRLMRVVIGGSTRGTACDTGLLQGEAFFVSRCLRPDPRDPDHSRPSPFDYHNCWKCDSGRRPCVNGSPGGCENLHARDD